MNLQGGPGTEPEPETGTVGTVFFSQEPNAEPEPPEPFSRNRNRNRNHPLCYTVLKHTKTPSLEEPRGPKTGTARTVPSPNRNRTEPNQGRPESWETQNLGCSSLETYGQASGPPNFLQKQFSNPNDPDSDPNDERDHE